MQRIWLSLALLTLALPGRSLGAYATAPAAPPARATPTGLPDEATIQAYVDRTNPLNVEQSVQQGLTRDEARCEATYSGMLHDEVARRAGQACGYSVTLTPADQHAVLGDAAYADMLALDAKMRNHHLAAVEADRAAHPVTGPISNYVPATGLLQGPQGPVPEGTLYRCDEMD